MSRHPNITTQWVEISPDTAIQWLEKYNKLNRPVKDTVVKKYAKDMREGRWLQNSAEPIIIDWDGILVDGQHRLFAVWESGCTISFLIVEGCDPQQRQVTDIGVSRNARDILSFEGVSAPIGALAVVKRMLDGFTGTTKLTIPEQREAYLRHQKAVDWVLSTFNCRQKGLKHSAVLAPVTRAYYTADRDRLTRFLEILRTGIMDDQKEVAVILLRNYVLSQSQAGHTSGGQAAVDLYGKAERALSAFLAGEQLTRLYAATEELFPIADDSPKAKRIPKPAKVVGIKRGKK